jgi:NADPH:quinone reductase-like Zn-dependent oxidoreductase
MYGTGSLGKQVMIASLGATPIDYEHQDFERRIEALAGRSMAAVFDPIGGPHFRQSFRTLRPGGRLVAFGFYDAVLGRGSIPLDAARIALLNLLPNRRSASLYSIGAMKRRHPGCFRQDLAALFSLLERGKLRPMIAGRLRLEDAARAHRMIERGEVAGRLVLLVGAGSPARRRRTARTGSVSLTGTAQREPGRWLPQPASTWTPRSTHKGA